MLGASSTNTAGIAVVPRNPSEHHDGWEQQPSLTPRRTDLDSGHAARQYAMSLVEQIQALACRASAEQQSTWAQCAERVQEVIEFLASDGTIPPSSWSERPLPKWQLEQFGKLVRDNRGRGGRNGWAQEAVLFRGGLIGDVRVGFL
jgi:hypothetical protein